MERQANEIGGQGPGDREQPTLVADAAKEGGQTLPPGDNCRPDGPPDRTFEDFADIIHRGCRREAFNEYQRTLAEFRETGEVREREWGDFAHLINPPNLQFFAFNAHGEALLAIENWQEAQETERNREESDAASAGLLAPPAKRAAEAEPESEADGLSEPEPESEGESLLGQRLVDCRRRINAQKARLAGQPVIAPRNASRARAAASSGLLRGVAFDPAVPSRNNRFDSPVARLDLAALPDRLPATDQETENLLNALIGECHFLMREVAFRSMCQADVLEDRRLWANTAMSFATTGATVANSVANLRHGVSVKETRHTTIIQNQVAAQVGGGGSTPS